MSNLVEQILTKDYRAAELTLEESFKVILERKMCEMKKKVAAKDLMELPHDIRMKRLKMDVLEAKDEDEKEDMEDDGEDKKDDEEEGISEARINIVRARIRGGKIQRRKKVSNVAGMTLRGGKLTRMSPSERRRRKLGAKKAARKSRAKKSQMLRKRRMSLMKRSRLGL
jgi:hypothetical protein